MPVVEGKADFPVAHSDFEFEPQTDIGPVWMPSKAYTQASSSIEKFPSEF